MAYPPQYTQGINARINGRQLDQCPYSMADGVRRAWWLAGWHDKDMERKAKLPKS